jgi:hypothetical protein
VSLDHASLQRVYRQATLRLMSRVQPGWWVRSYNGDDSEVWSEVTITMVGENILTNRKFVRLLCVVNGENLEVKDEPRRLIMCCTAVEAKRAGLAHAVTSGSDGAA